MRHHCAPSMLWLGDRIESDTKQHDRGRHHVREVQIVVGAIWIGRKCHALCERRSIPHAAACCGRPRLPRFS